LLKVTLHRLSHDGSPQHVPGTPLTFELHWFPAAHAQLSVEPQPSGKAEPHWPL